MLVLMLWVLLKGSLFILFFLPRSVSTRKSCTESYSAEITTALRCKGRWCLYKASQQLDQSIHPYLRRASGWEALIGDGRGWRLIGRGSNPTAVLMKGRGLIQEDTFELFTQEAVLVSPPRSLCVTLLLLDKELWLTMSVVFFLQETGDQRNIEPVHTCS